MSPKLEIAIFDFPHLRIIWTVSTVRKYTIDNLTI